MVKMFIGERKSYMMNLRTIFDKTPHYLKKYRDFFEKEISLRLCLKKIHFHKSQWTSGENGMTDI